MDIPGGIMIITYILLSIINVWAAFTRNWIPFCVSKSMLMLVLIGVYIQKSIFVIPWVVLALLFAWFGDVLLLRGDKSARISFYSTRYALTYGGFAFIISHLFYILTFCQLTTSLVAWKLSAVVSLVYILTGSLFYVHFVQNSFGLDRSTKIGIGVYIFALLMMSFSSTLIVNPHDSITYIPFVGSLFFMLSDFLLAIGCKTDHAFRYRPWAMASYLTAQFVIIWGLLLMEIK